MEREQVLRLLDEREAACQAEVERLQSEAERIGGLLAASRVELERVATARAVVAELVTVAEPATASAGGAHGIEVADAGVLAFSEQVVGVLAARGRPVRCREVASALGLDPTVARHGERIRHRLKKLAVAGRVVQVSPGLFTLAGEARAATG